ncbi:hypothetical protein U1Q18_019379 [Sarracenia purpurea var. burkii]
MHMFGLKFWFLRPFCCGMLLVVGHTLAWVILTSQWSKKQVETSKGGCCIGPRIDIYGALSIVLVSSFEGDSDGQASTPRSKLKSLWLLLVTSCWGLLGLHCGLVWSCLGAASFVLLRLFLYLFSQRYFSSHSRPKFLSCAHLNLRSTGYYIATFSVFAFGFVYLEVSLCGFLLPCAILSDLVSVFHLVFSVCFLGFSLYAYRSCPRPESYWYFSPLRGGSSIVPVAGIATPLCATFAFTGGSEWLFLEDFLRSDPEACSLAALLDGKGGRFWLLQLPSAPRWLDLPTRLRDLRASCA